jgi:hypothetical protein
MISGVLSVLLGEAILLGSVPLLVWFLAFFALNALSMPLIEERSWRVASVATTLPTSASPFRSRLFTVTLAPRRAP